MTERQAERIFFTVGVVFLLVILLGMTGKLSEVLPAEFGKTGSPGYIGDMSYPIADTGSSYILASAPANATIDSLCVFGYSTGGTGDVSVGVYDVADDGLVDSSTAIVLTQTTEGASQWEAVATSIALTEGHGYYLVIGNEDGGCFVGMTTDAGKASRNTGISDLPATWTHPLSADNVISMYAVYTTGEGETTKRFGVIK